MQHFKIPVLLTLFNLCAVTLSFGQGNFKKNDIYLEAGGNGLFGSVNYERQLTKEPALGARIGVGFYTEKAFYLTIPVGINYLFKLKKENTFIDAGLGVTWVRENGILLNESKSNVADHFTNFVPSIGYRKHTARNVMWRVSVTPVINEFGFVPWVGASIGKRF
jgi:hypothetical protein